MGEIQPGRTVGEFVLEEAIGQGGQGVVFRAFQPVLQRHAVVKLLASEGQPDRISRFLQEARLASRLEHPYAAHIYAFGVESDGVMWFAMELVRGTPLSAILEHGALEGGLAFIQRVCEVVQATHELGVIHADLKPSNIMVVSHVGNRYPKLLDFGIARELRDSVGEGAGTPAYMAPEQWLDGRSLSPATDVYALGALAFEILTGKPAFSGSTRIEIAVKHARGAPPRLPDNFPPRLAEALVKALAKRPEDRFANAGELANALRGDERAIGALNLPRLDELTRDEALLSAPEPIAEAIVALDAASGPAAAYTAAWGAVHAVAQYVGVVALGCRARVRGVDSDRVAALLLELRTQGLGAKHWWDLARELARPFAHVAEAYPIPELLGTFFAERAELTTSLDLIFKRAEKPLADAPVEIAVEELVRIVPELGVALRSLHWLRDYRLAIPARRGALVCMGARRRDRGSLDLPAPLVEPALLTDVGSVALKLGAVIAVEVPVPGTPRELFLLDGPGRRGARFRAIPGGFEHEVVDTWDRLHIAATTREDGRAEHGSPYMGLATFTQEQSSLFFGRERELEELNNRLLVNSYLAVVGPSGAGKSSFIRAGLLPTLAANDRALTLRPGSGPLRVLATILGSEAGLEPDVDALRERPSGIAALVERAAVARSIVIFVDQFEETFTLCADRLEQHAFASALMVAAEHPRVRVIVTLRDDFLLRAAQVPALRGLGGALQLLTTPAPDDLLRILTEPARRSGYAFEDAELPQEIVAELANQPSALALLSFAASELWQLRDRSAKHLTRKAYRALGGVGGALSQHAEAVLAEMPDRDQKIVRELFRHLVTADGTRATLTRDELLQVGGGEAASSVIEALIGARLLTAMETPDGGESIEVVHETLLVSWPRLVQWRASDAESARLRDQLRAAAKQWQDRGRPRGMLWRSDALVEYRLWRGRYPGSLTALEEEFGGASVAEANRGRRIRRALLATAIAALVVALAVFAHLRSAADASRRVAQEQLVESYLDQASHALSLEDSFSALVYLDLAGQLGASSFAEHFIATRALDEITPAKATLIGHHGKLRAIRFAGDRSVLTTGFDGTLRRWAFDGTAQWVVEATPPGADPVVAVDRTGTRIATGSAGAIALRDGSGKLLRTLNGHEGQLRDLQFATDGAHLVSAGYDGTVRRWDVETGDASVIDLKTRASVRIAVAPGAWVAGSANDSGTESRIAVWRDGAPARVLEAGPGDAVSAIALTPDGTRAAIGRESGVVELWDLVSDRRLETVPAHDGATTALVFTGRWLVSTGSDATVKEWDRERLTLVRTLRGHHGHILRAQAVEPGRLATTSVDGTAKLWDLETGLALRTFDHGGILDLAVDTEHRLVATSSTLGTGKLWDLDAPTGVELLGGAAPDPSRSAMAIFAQRERLARLSELGVEIWNLANFELVARVGRVGSVMAAQGDTLYVADHDTVTAVDIADGKTARTWTAPFDVTAMCAEPGSGRVVVTGGAPARLAILGESRTVPIDGTPSRLACSSGEVAASDSTLAVYALPSLERLGVSKVAPGMVPVVLPDGAIAGTSDRTQLSVWRHGHAITAFDYGGIVATVGAGPRTIDVGLTDGSVVEREIGDWHIVRDLKAHQAPVIGIAVADRLLATLGADQIVRLWTVDSSRALFEAWLPVSTFELDIAGDLLIATDGVSVELRRLGVRALTPDDLDRTVRCLVPEDLARQITHRPHDDRQVDCRGVR